MYNLIILPTTVLLKAPAAGQPQVIVDPAQGESKKDCPSSTKLRV